MTEIMKQLKTQIEEAELVLIGIGEEVEENFIDFEERSKELLAKTQKNDWTIPFLKSNYLSNQVDNQYIRALKNLKELVNDKNYFIITTSKDGYIRKAGFQNEKIVTPCGNYEFLQCGGKCNDQLIPAEDIVKQIYESKCEGKETDIPKCEICGEPLCFNNVYAQQYNEQVYMDQWNKYTKWLQGTINKRVCIIELGVGLVYPTVIRWPFEKVAMYNLKASFYRIHETLYQLPDEISEKGISLKMNALQFLLNL